MQKKKISIIGAGPIGLYTAYILQKAGHNVLVFEKKTKIGRPLQCAGIVSRHLSEFFNINELKKQKIIQNTATGADIISPNKTTLKIRTNKVQAYILKREAFDEFILKKAKATGVKIYTNHKYIMHKNKTLIVSHKQKLKHIGTDILIGADGPLSEVSKKFKNSGKKKYIIGLQHIVACDNLNKLTSKDNVVLDLKASSDFFGWVIPVSSKVIKIGVASEKKTNYLLKKYIDSLKKKGLIIRKTIQKSAGLIPKYDKSLNIERKNNYLIGDAASIIKDATGGGIIMGLRSAHCLLRAINNKESYKRLIKKEIKKELDYSKLIRIALNNMSNKEKDLLISIFLKQKIRQILEKKGDMDSPSRFIFKLIAKEPSLLMFSKRFFFKSKNK